MTLRDYFTKEGISLFAALPFSDLPLRLPRLLSSFSNPVSVVFAAVPYYREGEGNLARFARVRDYHAFAKTLGDGAVALLKSHCPETVAVAFADHSPFDEVKAAALAGLGLLGDNGLLITEKYSSFVFLFALVTDRPLSFLLSEGIPEGTGVIKPCEHCGACALACPGACIGGGRENCLSAITQKKGELTAAESALLKASPFAWGCDRCAEVCPHTTRARAAGTLETKIPYFWDHTLSRLTVSDLEKMPEEEYKRYPFGWRPKETIIRNLTLQEDKL